MIYHITHLDNLPGIIADGGLVSDSTMVARGGPPATIGMTGIKKRRIEEYEVGCHPYATFLNQVERLNQLNWPAIGATDFRPPEVKEGKQAEFLVLADFPWELLPESACAQRGYNPG